MHNNTSKRHFKLLLITFSDNADHQDTTFGMYEALQNEGDWDVYLLAKNNPKVSLQKSDHTWLINCPPRPGVCKETFNLPLLLSVIHKIQQQHFDAIYFESLHVWNLPIMYALHGKTHIYHVIHDVIPHKGDKAYKKVDLFNRILVKLSDTIILRNKRFIPSLINRYHVSADKVKFLELWRRWPTYSAPTHSHVALFFGRMNPYKGMDNLLQITKMCPKVNFQLVGKVDPAVQDIIEALKKEPNVQIQTGYVSDECMKQCFINSDWVIIPYESASQSGVIIDAYKYSRPVIAFDVGAISEQVKNEESGFLIPAGKVEKFASCLNKVMNLSKDEFSRYSQQAYIFGSEKYAVQSKVSNFKKLIQG